MPCKTTRGMRRSKLRVMQSACELQCERPFAQLGRRQGRRSATWTGRRDPNASFVGQCVECHKLPPTLKRPLVAARLIRKLHHNEPSATPAFRGVM